MSTRLSLQGQGGPLSLQMGELLLTYQPSYHMHAQCLAIIQTGACFSIHIIQFKQWSGNFPSNNKILRTVRAGWQFWDCGDSFAPRSRIEIIQAFSTLCRARRGLDETLATQEPGPSQFAHPCGLVKVRNVRNGNQCLGFITQRIHPNSNSSCV